VNLLTTLFLQINSRIDFFVEVIFIEEKYFKKQILIFLKLIRETQIDFSQIIEILLRIWHYFNKNKRASDKLNSAELSNACGLT